MRLGQYVRHLLATPLSPPSRLVYFLVLSFPAAWALGVSYFLWPLLTLPLGIALLFQRPVRVPQGFGVWMLFLAWALLSATQLDDPIRVALFVWRYAIYLSATFLFLWIYNVRRRDIVERAVVRAFALLFIIVTVGGAIALAAPHASFRAPFEAVAPDHFRVDPTAHAYIHPELADVKVRALGREIGRPKTFFGYTNHWGATVALTAPFFFAALGLARRPWKRRALLALGILAVLPIVLSLNRGLWIGLGVAIGYACLRLIARRKLRLAGSALGVASLAVVLVLFSPLGQVVGERLSSQTNSDSTRAQLYSEAIDRTLTSPLLGHGGPRPSDEASEYQNKHAGTQGQIFFLAFSHGLVGAGLYLAWFVIVLFRTNRLRSLSGLWAQTVVVVSLTELAFYDVFPIALYIVMVAAAIALRQVAEPVLKPAEGGQPAFAQARAAMG
jgi:hypothetical protein